MRFQMLDNVTQTWLETNFANHIFQLYFLDSVQVNQSHSVLVNLKFAGILLVGKISMISWSNGVIFDADLFKPDFQIDLH